MNTDLYAMRIAVNTRLLLPGKLEGIGWFTYETLTRIVKDHPEHEFHFLFDRRFDPQFVFAPNVIPHVVPPPTRHPVLYRIWFGIQLPRVLRRIQADAFLSPDGSLCLSLPDSIPQLAVIHDLNFEHYPEDLPKAYRNYYRRYFPQYARKAARIVTVSDFSKQDIATRYGIPEQRIDRVYNGVSPLFRPSSAEEKSAAREKFAGGKPYLICVGSLHPRKNIARLLEAFDQVTDELSDVCLVVVGESFWWDDRMKSAWNKVRHKDRVLFTGRLEQMELCHAIGGAMALAYVSYFEGFGIPVVEAMRCGIPVVAANATSLPEVAGEAAVYCDPFSVDDIGRALKCIMTDEELRVRSGEAGIARSSMYSWENTAEGLWKSLEKMLA